MASTTVEGLNKTQLKRFREQLLAKAEDVRASMRAGEALNGERLADPDDQAVKSHEEWIFLNRNSIDTMLLREIQESLSRIDAKTYGLCLECEEPISRNGCRPSPGRGIACLARKSSLRRKPRIARRPSAGASASGPARPGPGFPAAGTGNTRPPGRVFAFRTTWSR